MFISEECHLFFQYGFDERDQFEARSRGYMSHVQVRFSSGLGYSVCFYDCVRLQQDLEEEVRLGNVFIAEPGMIVLSEITPENIRRAVSKLDAEGFFDALYGTPWS